MFGKKKKSSQSSSSSNLTSTPPASPGPGLASISSARSPIVETPTPGQRAFRILLTGAEHVGKTTMLKRFMEKYTPNHPSSTFSPLTINVKPEKPKAILSILKFYELDIVKRPDNGFEPIQWRSYYDKIEMIVYMINASQYPNDQLVANDITFLQHFLECGHFYEKYNTYANIPIMFLFDKGTNEKIVGDAVVGKIVEPYRQFWVGPGSAGRDSAQDNIFFHFACADDEDILDSIHDNAEHIAAGAQVTDLLTLTFNPYKRFKLKSLVSAKEQRFNRMNPNTVDGSGGTLEKIPVKAVEKLYKLLTTNYNITELNLRNNSLKKQAAETLLKGVQFSKTLLYLNLSYNQLGDDLMPNIATMLRINSSLKKLVLMKNEITDAGIHILAPAFEQNSTLVLLDLSENLITGRGCTELCNQIQSNQSMTSLSFWLNKIGPDGYTAIADLLRWNTSLLELDVSDIRAPDLDISLWYNRWVKAIGANQNSSMQFLQYTYGTKDIDDELQAVLAAISRRKRRTTVDPVLLSKNSIDLSNCKLTKIPVEYEKSIQASPLEVESLNLAYNSFASIPDIVFMLENLTSLSVAGNNLTGKLTNFIGHLPNLKSLDLSNNQLSTIPPEIGSLTDLTTLDLRWNRIISLPPQLFDMTQLVNLNLQCNLLLSISDEIFKLSRLENFLLSGNAIPKPRQMILNAWSCKATVLDLSGCELTALPREIGALVNLEELNLRNNNLLSLPPEVGELTKLTTLDISNNSLETLPWTLGQLKSLTKIVTLPGNNWLIPAEALNNVNSLKAFLEQLKDGAIQLTRMKLMLVGQENVGKTSIARCFKEVSAKSGRKLSKKSPLTISTDGIDIEDWEPPVSDDSKLRFNVWDFGGQEVYYNTHQFFLSKNCIYLICFKLCEKDIWPRVDYWLQSISSKTTDAPILLVGTHLDSSKNTKQYLSEVENYVATKFKKRFPQLKGFFQVSCKTKKNIDILINEVVNIAKSKKAQPYPKSYLQLEDMVVAERNFHTPPVINLNAFKKMVSFFKIPEDSAQSIAEFFNELGILIYFKDGRSGLDDMLILDPQWLTSLLATLITTKQNFVKNGLLKYSNLGHIWCPPKYPLHLHDKILVLFEHFGVAHRLTIANEVQILIPCLLDSEKPSNWDSTWKTIVTKAPKVFERSFKFPFLPLGFFARVMSGIVEIMQPELFFRHGLIATTRNKEHLLFEYDPTKVEVILSFKVCAEHVPVNLLRLVVDSIHGLIENWYNVPFHEFIPYNGCNPPIDIKIKELEECISVGKQVYTAPNSKQIPINDVAPDLTLSDFTDYMVNYSDIAIKKELGRGSFGFVSLGMLNGKTVAVKTLVLPTIQNLNEIIRDFRRELWIGSSLQHDNIVGIIGCCTAPHFSLIMEYVPYGNVYEHLRKPDVPIGWPFRIKIALDVAKGMSFLHGLEPKITHRDLKTPNILLASLDGSAPVVAKLTDFGETRGLLVKLKGRGGLTNPSWLAPEIMKDEMYTEKADVFSFGIIMWEIYIRQHPYAEYPVSYSKFVYQFEDAILKNIRPTFPKECNERYARLAAKCWAPEPAQRPTFPTIHNELLEIQKEVIKDTSVINYNPDLFLAAKQECEAMANLRYSRASQTSPSPNNSKALSATPTKAVQSGTLQL